MAEPSSDNPHERDDLVVHFVGSIPLPDNAAVFRTLSRAAGAYVERLPDGETGIRQSWIRYLQDVLAAHPAIEVASGVPPFRFVQWDGKLVREIPRLTVTDRAALDPAAFETGYAAAALASWSVFEQLQRAGEIPAHVRFQICLPTPTAPTYNNMMPIDRPAVLAALTAHLIGEVRAIADALPHDRIALQWDVCQEVLAWEGYYEPGPVDFRDETLAVLGEVGNAVPERIELGFHLCYGSPADEHIVQPRDLGVAVEIANAIRARVARPIAYVHMPVPRARTDADYFAPLASLGLDERTDLYLGLIHHDDAAGDAARLEAARRFARVAGVAAECGLGRGDPSRLEALLAAHLACAEHGGRAADPEIAEIGARPRFRDPHAEPDALEDAGAALSPSVRRLVKQYGLDISGLRGTGPGGRIRIADVMGLLGGRDGPADAGAAQRAPIRREADGPGGRGGRGGRGPSIDPGPPNGDAPARGAGGVATTVFECDAGRVLEDQRRRRAQGHEIALSAYFAAALARALRETQAYAAADGVGIPTLGIEPRRGPDGAHVLAQADALSLEQIQAALHAPAERPADPYVLVRHHGRDGSLLVQPEWLAPGELAVLGIGCVRRQVVVRLVNGEEAPRIASQCLLSLSFRDEQLGLDGANAVLARCVAELERWHVIGDARH